MIRYAIRREDRRAAGFYAVNGTDPYEKGYKYAAELADATIWPTAEDAAQDLEIRLEHYYRDLDARFVIVPVVTTFTVEVR